MPRTPQQAVAWALQQNSWRPPGMCLQFVRSCFGVAARYPDAQTAWEATRYKHRGDRTPPAGVPMWWTGGSRGFGHVAISLGGGRFRSTDVPVSGLVGNTTIDRLGWSHTYVGWSEDINGVRVYEALPDTGEDDDDMTPAQAATLNEIAKDTAYIQEQVKAVGGDVNYVREQNISIARTVLKLADASDDIDDAEMDALRRAASGQDR